MGAVQMTVCARSDVGRVRKNNEDAFIVIDLDTGARVESERGQSEFDVRERGILLVVSDGMGGHAAGEVASALVVDSLRESLGTELRDRTSMQRLIDNAVKRANADVFAAAHATSKAGMGATLTAVLVHRDEAYVAEVGDSRAYLLRSGRIRQITKDQSFVQMLIDAGALTPEQAKASDQKNIILQGMGLKEDVEVSIGHLQLRRGDRLLLCCDGLSNLVTDDELRDLLGGAYLTTACNRMVDLANERGGDDNITVILAELDGPGLPLPAFDETVTDTFFVLQEYGPTKKPRAPTSPAAKTPSKSPSRPPPHSSKPPPHSTPRPPTSSPPPPASIRPARGDRPWPLLGALAAAGLAIMAVTYWLLR